MRILRDSFGFLELGVSLGVQFEDFFKGIFGILRVWGFLKGEISGFF